MAASGVPVAAADTVWYKWLDKRYQGASTKMALRKAGVDFVLGAPLLNMVWLTSEFSIRVIHCVGMMSLAVSHPYLNVTLGHSRANLLRL